MKIIASIPARYNSTRVPNKPLIDICGKPMIWWVYQQAKKVSAINEIYVATDDQRIVDVCNELNLNVILTSKEHTNCVYRLHEVSERFEADLYMNINGDEPLVESASIEKVVNEAIQKKHEYIFAVRKLTNPAETNDISNIKVVHTAKGRVLYVSRAPIPCPYKGLNFDYKKFIGIKCFTKKALDLYANSPVSKLEKIEDMGVLRFLENDFPVYCIDIDSNSLSVDTPKDLEKVRNMMQNRLL